LSVKDSQPTDKKLHISYSTDESQMRILSNPVETETKSDVQNENKQVSTCVTSSLVCTSTLNLRYLNLILIFLVRANISFVQLNISQL